MKNIIIPNQKKTSEKIRKLIENGADNLHVVSDFDKTLTPYMIDGKIAESAIGQLRANGYLSNDYTKKSYELKDKYYPIEIDSTISLAIKKRKMIEWWKKHIKLVVKYGLNKKIVNNVIKDNRIILRKKSKEFFQLLNDKNVPLLIFSAGQGDFIEGMLNKEKIRYKNMHVVSNFFKFDKKGLVIGYKSKIIHTFNKNETQIKSTPYYNQIKHRKNVILLGDNLHDIHMVEGLNHEVILKIGFLNENVSKNLKYFKEVYDIIILNDADMGYVNKLIKNIK